MEKQTMLFNLSPDELFGKMEQLVNTKFDQLKEQFQPKEAPIYYTRKELKELLKVDYSTIHTWCKQKKLKPIGIGARVYFRKEDIDRLFTPLNAEGRGE